MGVGVVDADNPLPVVLHPFVRLFDYGISRNAAPCDLQSKHPATMKSGKFAACVGRAVVASKAWRGFLLGLQHKGQQIRSM